MIPTRMTVWLRRLGMAGLSLWLTPPAAAWALPGGAVAGGGAHWPWALAVAAVVALVLGLAQGSAPANDDEELDLEHMREVLALSRNKFKAIFDHITDPMVTVSRELTVESVNMACARMADTHPRELSGTSGYQLMDRLGVHPLIRQRVLELVDLAFHTGLRQQEVLRVDRSGLESYTDLVTLPMGAEWGNVDLVLIWARDITQQKQMEKKVLAYSQHLEEMVEERTHQVRAAHHDLKIERDRLAKANEELVALQQLRQDLTRMVVHDLKGPLAEIMGNLDLINYQPVSDMQKEALDLAQMGAEDLLRMIMNLLDIDRLEEGRLLIKPQEVTFGDIGGKVRDKFRTMSLLRQLSVQVQDDYPGAFECDAELMSRVLQNLLTNALNHTPEGGEIVLGAEPAQEGGITLWVRDTGVGIPLRHQQRIFEKFSQAGSSHASRTSTGLGLTFCKMAVEAHGGRIWVHSVEGKGTTFFVWLPVPLNHA